LAKRKAWFTSPGKQNRYTSHPEKKEQGCEKFSLRHFERTTGNRKPTTFFGKASFKGEKKVIADKNTLQSP